MSQLVSETCLLTFFFCLVSCNSNFGAEYEHELNVWMLSMIMVCLEL